MGITPLPDASRNVAAALKEAASTCELIMHWTARTGVGFSRDLERPTAGGVSYIDAVRRMGLEPILNVNPWTVVLGQGIVRNDGSGSADFKDAGFRQVLVREVTAAARRFRPRYFCIGNEVNTVAAARGMSTFRDLMELERALYKAAKAGFPGTRVVVVVSWSQLVDTASTPYPEMLRSVEEACDVLGVTSYPWRHYRNPDAIPWDYYLRISRVVHKPVGFTEIGWSSDGSQGGSETDQARFLTRFLELTRGMPLEFVNWAFLHDLPPEAAHGVVIQRTHLGLGLRRFDGTPKPVWRVWQRIHALPLRLSRSLRP